MSALNIDMPSDQEPAPSCFDDEVEELFKRSQIPLLPDIEELFRQQFQTLSGAGC